MTNRHEDCHIEIPPTSSVLELSDISLGNEREFLSSGKFYGGDDIFHPKEIITQIIVIQSAYYVILSGLILIIYSVLERPRSISLLFNPNNYTCHLSKGYSLHTIIFIGSIIIAFCIAAVVERTKKCLDFVITLHLIHWIICFMYYGIPTLWIYWILQLFYIIIITVISERLCMKTELQEIVLYKKTNTLVHSTPIGAASTIHTSALPSIASIRPRQELSILTQDDIMSQPVIE